MFYLGCANSTGSLLKQRYDGWGSGLQERKTSLCVSGSHGNANACIILQLKRWLFYRHLFNSVFWNEILWLCLIFWVHMWVVFFFFLSVSLYPMSFSLIYWIKSCITYGNGALSISGIPSLCQHTFFILMVILNR